jgi:hypothetical protein
VGGPAAQAGAREACQRASREWRRPGARVAYQGACDKQFGRRNGVHGGPIPQNPPTKFTLTALYQLVPCTPRRGERRRRPEGSFMMCAGGLTRTFRVFRTHHHHHHDCSALRNREKKRAGLPETRAFRPTFPKIGSNRNVRNSQQKKTKA